jgi:PEP-CTERM motif
MNHLGSKRYSTVVAAVLLAASAWTHAATTVVVATTLDVAEIIPGFSGFTGGVQGSPPFTPAFNVTLAEGDTFDFTIDFVGGQTLTLVDPTLLWALSYADDISFVTGTGTLSLLDASGGVLWVSNPVTSTEGAVHFGQNFAGTDFVGLPSNVTFGGLRYQGVVVDYLDPLVTTRNYATPVFIFNATSFTSAVPEPSQWLLMAGGLAAMGSLVRRRRV